MWEFLFKLNSKIQSYRNKNLVWEILIKIIEPCFNINPKFIVSKFLEKQSKMNNFDSTVITISFDCDLKEDVEAYPYLLKLLDKYNIKASFACVGKLIEMYPKEHALILEKGHEIINHTYTHPNHKVFNPNKKFNKLSFKEQKEEIMKCHEVCEKVLNYTPVGFRTPHFGGLHTENVYKILEEMGYLYSSSTLALRTHFFGKPYKIGQIIEFPLSPSPKYPLSCLETWGIWRAPKKKYTEEEYYKLFKWLLDLAIDNKLYLNFYFDPMDVVKLKYFEGLLSLISNFKTFCYKDLISKFYE